MTIVDIAKEAGYSVSTVSRVLNGRRDVSEEARDRIMRIVEAYQFVPNNNAKHLKQTVSQSILILVKGTSNMLFTNIIEVIQDTIEGSIEYDKVDKVRGMDIICVTTAQTDEEARELLTLFGMPYSK